MRHLERTEESNNTCIEDTLLWDMIQYSLVSIYEHFGGLSAFIFGMEEPLPENSSRDDSTRIHFHRRQNHIPDAWILFCRISSVESSKEM
jgi:hypothetical protein